MTFGATAARLDVLSRENITLGLEERNDERSEE